ncbi:heavy metal translocating P-type ATPase [Methylophilus medardicus]|uniref:Cation-translocating P-type ATPase n=1 Tax=Methylophilus medardicus TaxID=2588534 RepID=A0A5B8CRJ9_9PROT|nr:cation-translocating P-type ATPase [Methylophilus medardicus]QDC43924.1 cation-translocating P-type ATPase [Methylophilus medardicus]QDC48931.1 cation-translocating P-type ATPase [Methylophilus medardicus]QDC52636.1 cation-translocating P-type ATPase [Methylophilus medardicus]
MAKTLAVSSTNPWQGLDIQSEWERFSQRDASANEVWTSHVWVDNMHCAACSGRIEQAIKQQTGVLAVHASAASKRVRVIWDAQQISPSKWFANLNDIGYPALPLNEYNAISDRTVQQRKMLWRLVVAVFCMMQVMMYAYPTYLASSNDMAPDMVQLMKWASWVLTLPVMLFSATPFLSQAWASVKQGQLGMDVPVSLGILAAFVMSTLATFAPGGWWGDVVYYDSLTMFVSFLLIGRWLDVKLRNRTAGALENMMRRLPHAVLKKNVAGEWVQIAASNINAGDVLYIRPGEVFAADGLVLFGSTSVDESMLTGESEPVVKSVGAKVIAGSGNLTSAIEMQVQQVGEGTQYHALVNLMASASTEKPGIALLADKVAQPFLWGVLLAAMFAVIFWWTTDPVKAIMSAVAVLVVTCPCALSLATPAAMLASAGTFAKGGILIRRLQAIQSISEIDTIVFDKTGTLTESLQQVALAETHPDWDRQWLLDVIASMSRDSLHPVAQALHGFALNLDAQDTLATQDWQEIVGGGMSATIVTKAGESLHVTLGNAAFCGITNESDTEALRQVYVTSGATLLARLSLSEQVKPHAKAAISQLISNGLDIQLLSGDRIAPVKNLAAQLGIQRAYGLQKAEEKLQHVKLLQQQGRKVLMVGDGLNDGPVIAAAHTSIAMGSGVPLTQAQADMVVLGNDIGVLVSLISHCKKTILIVKQNLLWAALYNAAGVPLAIMGLLPAWLAGLGMAASSLLVLLNALRLTDWHQSDWQKGQA